jgi:hypothetical protein
MFENATRKERIFGRDLMRENGISRRAPLFQQKSESR